MANATVFLWYQARLSDVIDRYAGVFDDFEVLERSIVGENPSAEPIEIATVRVHGLELRLFDGGTHGDDRFSESTSIYLECDDQDQVDRYWEGLTRGGGRPGRCGWLTDPFGFTWQVVPTLFHELLARGDDAARGRVMTAMLAMDKFESAELQRAYEG